jgi:uncharacterized membrane protein
LRVIPALGEFTPAGAPLVRIDGEPSAVDPQVVIDSLSFGLERVLDQDVAYGFRMLVDMAERSLSDSPFLDPSTAVQAIDRLHDGLRQLAVRKLDDGRHHDDAGNLRLVVPVMDWEAYVHLAFDEVRLAGAASPQVTRRLIAALNDLHDIAPPERRHVLIQQLDLLQRAVRDMRRDERDVNMALVPDPQGIGVTASERVSNNHDPRSDGARRT